MVNRDRPQLSALSAVVAEGTFEAAARALHVTPSAISQRIRALESAAGRVLLVRSKPVRPTPSGEALLRLARQIETLAADTALELGADTPDSGRLAGRRPISLPIAVNADSLATWVLPALAPLASDFCFDIHREDQEHTAALLRAGTVVAAVTAEAMPVPGCSVTRLGAMRYRPLAAPAFAERWFPHGPSPQALAVAPVAIFDRKDDLQHRYLRSRTDGSVDPPANYVPSTADFYTVIRLGLGWGMLPDLQSGDAEGAGELVNLDPRGAIDVFLCWQQWKLQSASLDRVGSAVRDGARRSLEHAGAS